MINFKKYRFLKEKLNAPRFDNEDEEIDWFTTQLYGLYKQANRLREENNDYKEIFDKIKEMFKEESHEDGCEFCDKLEKLLEEINE